MKTLITILIITISFSTFAETKTCEQKSAAATKGAFAGYFTRDPESGTKRRIEQIACGLALRNTIVACEVSASNGDGSGDASFLVTLDRKCSKVTSVELIGEE